MTAEDVRTRQFSPSRIGRKGYDEQEVRGFLTQVASELETLVSARAEVTSRLEATQQALIAAQPRGGPAAAVAAAVDVPEAGTGAGEQAGPASETPTERETGTAAGPDDVATRAARVLALAQRTADEHVGQAQAEAEALLTQARDRAATMTRETDERRREVIGAIEAQRSELEQRIESLRGFEREYRSRLTSYLQQQLAELGAGATTDGSPAGQGAPAPGGHGSVDLRRPAEDHSPG